MASSEKTSTHPYLSLRLYMKYYKNRLVLFISLISWYTNHRRKKCLMRNETTIPIVSGDQHNFPLTQAFNFMIHSFSNSTFLPLLEIQLIIVVAEWLWASKTMNLQGRRGCYWKIVGITTFGSDFWSVYCLHDNIHCYIHW